MPILNTLIDFILPFLVGLVGALFLEVSEPAT